MRVFIAACLYLFVTNVSFAQAQPPGRLVIYAGYIKGTDGQIYQTNIVHGITNMPIVSGNNPQGYFEITGLDQKLQSVQCQVIALSSPAIMGVRAEILASPANVIRVSVFTGQGGAGGDAQTIPVAFTCYYQSGPVAKPW